MANKNLTNAKIAKKDEFYTRWEEIEKEVNAYLEYNKMCLGIKLFYCLLTILLKVTFSNSLQFILMTLV
ncbi:hypothetical protein C5L18_001258 [Lactobacillus amylolyticus]|uniref:adenine-specific methyltransferase EcoRI family protein n=1 Tax=Lactobacillus amylolyticus TaxID=83683 RepID=UPI0010DF7E92|nr:adenine-specific methyltransferase EcoRI family protein [Lactobacillus amylolyticus]TDG62845.1 hypothetical protein C5L18_001258 [Lactobacillus amylolyticus]